MKKNPTQERFALRLTKDEKTFVTLQADKDNRSINSTIRTAIQNYDSLTSKKK